MADRQKNKVLLDSVHVHHHCPAVVILQMLLAANLNNGQVGLCLYFIDNYTVNRKKSGSTFDIITLEKHARFL